MRTLGFSRASDLELTTYAETNSRIVLTFDLDFGEILAVGVRTKPSVILFRLSDERAIAVNKALEVVLLERATALESGAIVLVEDRRYRTRMLPIGG